MKAILLTSAMVFSASLSASPFAVTQDPDQYDGYEGSKVFPSAVQPGIGDNYASSFLYSTGFSRSGYEQSNGSNDAYGSVILDIGHPIDW
jgi:hypothetical protein